MGAETCRKVEPDNNQVSTHDKARNCFDVCYKENRQINNKDKVQIKPIQFSDAGEGSPQPQKNSEMNAKSTAFNFQSSGNIQSPNKNKSTGQPGQPKYTHQHSLIQPQSIHPIIVQKSKDGTISYLNNHENYEPISVPYSVIRLMIQSQILKQIKKYDHDFHTQHGHEKAETYRTWKLLKCGAYANLVSDGTTIVVKEKQYYRGRTIFNTFVPDGDGLLVTLVGTYKGYFKIGKAHGQGFFVSIDGKKKYEGIWKAGELQKGKIITDDYKYEGQLSKGIPNGRGVLNFIKSKTQYIGSFKNGVFQDPEATYKCQNYIYKGGFVKGKKDGFGILTPIKKSSGGTQLRNLPKLTGKFQQDIFKKSQLGNA